MLRLLLSIIAYFFLRTRHRAWPFSANIVIECMEEDDWGAVPYTIVPPGVSRLAEYDVIEVLNKGTHTRFQEALCLYFAYIPIFSDCMLLFYYL